MRFTIVASALAAATVTAAAPIEERAEPNVFSMQILATGTPIHHSPVSASKSKVLTGLGLSKQDFECDDDPGRSATFYITDGHMYLYSEGKGEDPHVFMDPAKGNKIGYTIAGQTAPDGAERMGWITAWDGPTHQPDRKEYLVWKGSPLVACPGGPSGSYELYVSDGETQNPNGKKDCTRADARVLRPDSANSCKYTKGPF